LIVNERPLPPERTETMNTGPGPGDILDLSRAQLAGWLEEHGIAPYRAGQILRWIYLRQKDRFDEMTDLSKDIRAVLPQHFTLKRLERRAVETSADGTRKYLFGLADGNSIESVLIPERDHSTLCVSSQVGCAQDCRFCLTAKGRLIRNLTPGEILAQVRDVRHDLPEPGRLSNLVFMGMGEPLANFSNLMVALEIITDADAGLGFSTRHVTVSTAGLVPKMVEFGRRTKVNIAVSLNAVDSATRSRLMPINRTYPLEELLEACRSYPLPAGRRITFEYILIQGVNDSPQDALKLARLLRGIRCKVNLIPFNPHAGSEFKRPAEEAILAFREVLLQKHYTVIIRQSKGGDISAACGQLRARSIESSKLDAEG
jgi:23S rRNA (adenine2503-C2)-methyltransferase